MGGNRKNKSLIAILFIVLGFILSSNIVEQYFTRKLDKCFSSKIDKSAIIEKGDVKAYNAFVDSVRTDKRVAYNNSNFIDYSLIMAHRHNYARANYDVYTALISVFGEEKTDSLTKKLALYYLNRGANMGDSLCLNELTKREIVKK